MLAAHADRERAVDVLRAGFAEGRLQQNEFERRVQRAYEARTVAELSLLVADLPQGPSAVQQQNLPQLTGYGAPVPRTFLPAPPPPTNGKAVGAMICGVLTTMTFGITGIPAVILGHTARNEIRRTGESGDGLAMAGIVLGWISVAGWAFFLAIMFLAVASGA
ncbi:MULTISPECIES: DUF1707 and DUF4190 domain-containing protein [unclassified Streptomyces]|uniref:DUF1707 and DUF4190 domain-containing protein n=1 Tax=unclassified Streptomyces TaxID=2593676 RepID=UPI0038162166